MESFDDLGWQSLAGTGLTPDPSLGLWPDLSFDISQDWWNQGGSVSYDTPPLARLPAGTGRTNASPVHSAARSRVSLACIPCRSRHAKCDAVRPTCSQCISNSRGCSYAEPRRARTQKLRKQQTRSGATSEVEPLMQAHQSRLLQDEPFQHRSVHDGIAQSRTSVAPPSMLTTTTTRQRTSLDSSSNLHIEESSKLLDQYYAAFHVAHPFILPRRFLEERAKSDHPSVQYLLPVVELVGSLYCQSGQHDALRSHVEDTLRSENLPATGFVVQALLIFAIAQHSCNDFLRARETLDQAIRIALQINMNSGAFCVMQGEGIPVLEESWRRTWWFLYVTDGMFAGQRRCKTFLMLGISTDVDLPCEEAAYESADVPIPHSLAEYEDRELTGDGCIFSSFAYLVGLAQLIGPALALGTDVREPYDSEVLSADASLVAWEMYLPKRKHLVIEEPGKLDEVIFLAHMLHNTLKVFIHRPQSLLCYSAIECSSRCAPPPGDVVATDKRSFDFHTLKTLQAAEAGIGLFSLPSSFGAHSPLVICGLTILILAQISACRLKVELSTYASARDHVRLGMGAVKAMGQVWKVGIVTMHEVQTIAQEMLLVRSARDGVSD